jgi:hypothetical protein
LFYKITDNVSLWEKASKNEFSHLRHTKDASPYQDDWMALFKDKNRRNTSMFYSWIIDDIDINERRTSPRFTIGEFSFELICDPYGNPNIDDDDDIDEGVSAYIQCTNKHQWECTGVFSLRLSNPMDENIYCEWGRVHRFHNNAPSWGVHSITPLDKLPKYVADNKTKLTINIRLFVMKIQVYTSVISQGFGLEKTDARIYYIHSLAPLKEMIANDFNIPVHSLRLWLFANKWNDNSNYKVRMKCLMRDDMEVWNLLQDQYLYNHQVSIFAENTTTPITKKHRLFFIKWLDKNVIHHVGTITVSPSEITLKRLFEIVSDLVNYPGIDFGFFLEHRPNKFNRIIHHDHGLDTTLEEFFQEDEGHILVFYKKFDVDIVNKCYKQSKIDLLDEVELLKNQRIIKIRQVYDLYERCGFHLFRLHKLYTSRICKNGRNMLDHILYTHSHLDYWCDSCGTKDIKGVRYKCTKCKDYDLCSFCFANTTQFRYRAQFYKHRYTYIPCTDHSISHAMTPIHPFPAL